MRRAQRWPGSFESERDSDVTEFQHRRPATLILHKSSTVTPSLTLLNSNGTPTLRLIMIHKLSSFTYTVSKKAAALNFTINLNV